MLTIVGGPIVRITIILKAYGHQGKIWNKGEIP